LPNPDALWQRGQIEVLRLDEAPPLTRIVVAVDPPATSGAASAACGIVAAGLDANEVAVVICDATIERASPEAWAMRAVATYHALGADALVAEVNQGGDMVETVIRQADRSVPVRQVRATRGKWVRAEPVALLYAQGRVRHAGVVPALEDQLCDFGPDGLSGGASPDRLDALVWAVTALLLERTGLPQVRRI
jgi:phage terminase large subunit-like protein